MRKTNEWKNSNGLLTLKEVALLYGDEVNYERLKKWTQRGIMPVAARQGRRVFVNKRDVEMALKERTPELLNN
jgi:predicted site-specific integrase-resolvase